MQEDKKVEPSMNTDVTRVERWGAKKSIKIFPSNSRAQPNISQVKILRDEYEDVKHILRQLRRLYEKINIHTKKHRFAFYHFIY